MVVGRPHSSHTQVIAGVTPSERPAAVCNVNVTNASEKYMTMKFSSKRVNYVTVTESNTMSELQVNLRCYYETMDLITDLQIK